MSVQPSLDVERLLEAVDRGDVPSVTNQIQSHEFVLLHVGEDDDSEDLGALTADYESEPYLVSFSSPEYAKKFVADHADLFDQDDEISGFIVDGETLLDYLDDGYGLLINPESGSGARLNSHWVADILVELGLAE
ncbi:MAG: hypothetical protein AAGD07_24570 [Planctomycetota bacterium]